MSRKKTSVLIVAGEVSGDTLAASILTAWKKIDDHVTFWGLGGPQMAEQGVEVLVSTDELATIGLWEAAKKYRKLKKLALRITKEARERNTSHAILVDYPGFNLKLAQMLSKAGIRCYQVVSPTIWAWHYSRVEQIKLYIDSVYCLFPFETEIYEKENVESHLIGHPVVETVANSKRRMKKPVDGYLKRFDGRLKIAILPGSRKLEIENHLPLLLEAAEQFRKKYPNAHFFIPSATEQANDRIHVSIRNSSLPDCLTVLESNAHLAMQICDAAIVCSGTATLECALFQVPFLLIYKTSFLTYWLGKRLIKLPYVGIVNIIRGKFVTKELIQHELTVEGIIAELENILFDSAYRDQMLHEFEALKKEMGSGKAGRTAARLLSKKIKS